LDFSYAIDLLNKGGYLVWPILFCSIGGMTIFFERLTLYRKVLKNHLGNDLICLLLSSGDFTGAKHKLSSSLSKYSIDKRIMLDALNINTSDNHTLEMILTHDVAREIELLSRTLNTLAVFASVAPLLGLLGTVIGMIKAFSVVESMGGSVNAAVLAGGIWEAMLTTAFGLMAAIPLLFFHNHLEGKLQLIQSELEDVAITFMKAWSEGKLKSHKINLKNNVDDSADKASKK